MKKKGEFRTLCVHEGNLKDLKFKGSVSPLYMSTSYAFYEEGHNRYPRYFNTPNQIGLGKKLAALEGAELGLIFGSGMAAISTALLSHLKQGDHIIIQNDLYGGTRHFIKETFPKYNISYTFTDGLTVGNVEKLIQENTKGIYLESPSNPLLKIIDLSAMSKLAKGKKLWTMIDNTFASPVNQNPVEFGIDVVIHSGTKYLGGHSDILAGAIVTSNEHMKKIIRTAKNLGGSLSDSTVWLLERSMKTLFIRVAAQNQNAQKLADHLEKHELISKVNYPGLMSHPQHELAIKQMKGFGGMLSFELMPNVKTSDFFKNLKLIKPSMSLAGVESTLLSPRLTSHASLTETERKQQGITEQLIRFSVGIEDVEDLKNDLNQALINAEKNNKL